VPPLDLHDLDLIVAGLQQRRPALPRSTTRQSPKPPPVTTRRTRPKTLTYVKLQCSHPISGPKATQSGSITSPSLPDLSIIKWVQNALRDEDGLAELLEQFIGGPRGRQAPARREYAQRPRVAAIAHDVVHEPRPHTLGVPLVEVWGNKGRGVRQ
jgi:hypothetical protein